MAASSAAPSAIKVICQPAMPPAVTYTDGRRYAGAPAGRRDLLGERGGPGGGICQQGAGEPGQDAEETADASGCGSCRSPDESRYG